MKPPCLIRHLYSEECIGSRQLLLTYTNLAALIEEVRIIRRECVYCDRRSILRKTQPARWVMFATGWHHGGQFSFQYLPL